jgi:hypothetical protein
MLAVIVVIALWASVVFNILFFLAWRSALDRCSRLQSYQSTLPDFAKRLSDAEDALLRAKAKNDDYEERVFAAIMALNRKSEAATLRDFEDTHPE